MKRGAVQLYHVISLKDHSLMDRFQMSGSRAYSTYCNIHRDFNAESLPEFMDAEAFIDLATTMAGERNIITDDNAFKPFIAEHTEVEESDAIIEN